MIAKLLVNFTLALTVVTPAAAKKNVDAASTKPIEFIQQTIAKYNSQPAVHAKVEKTVYLSLLEETKTSEGEMHYSKGQMRLEMKGDERSLIVMTPKAVWIETQGLIEGDKPQVTQVVAKDLAKQSRAPIALILGQSRVLLQFKVEKDEMSGDVRKIKLLPKKPKEWKDLQSFYTEINASTQALELIQYEDDLGNRTTYKLMNTDFKSKIEKSLFNYRPPKDAEVSIYK